MRSQRGDSRVLLRIRIGIGCCNDDDPEPSAILATRRQHRCSQCIALPVAQRKEKRHLLLYMGLEADVALDRVGSLRTPGLDCLLLLAAKIFLDRMAHPSRYGTRPYRSARRKHTAFRSSCDPRNSRAASLQNQYEILDAVALPFSD